MSLVTIATEKASYKTSVVALLESVRVYAANVRVLVLTDDPRLRAVLRGIGPELSVCCAAGTSSRQFKTRLPHYVETEFGIYMDADAVVRKRIPWSRLPRRSLCMTPCPQFPTLRHNTTISVPERRYTFAMLGADAPQLNSGVMVWRRSDSVRLLFDLWHSEWRRFSGRDQFAFHRALHLFERAAGQPFEVGVLPTEWNSPRDGDDTIVYHRTRHPCAASPESLT